MVALAFFLGHWHMRSLDEHGRALVAAEQYVPAIRVLSGVVAEAPGDARAHYYLGLAYAGVGLCGAASIHLEEAARLAPEYRRHSRRPRPGLPECRVMLGITGPDSISRSRLTAKESTHMKRFIRNHRGMVVGAGLVGLALVAGVGLGPHMGFTAGPKTPLWTERAVNVAPTQVQAPNWVELAKELKPAVVNVSTKRVESGPQMRGPSGSGDPFEQFYRQFGDQAPKRNVRSMGSGFAINSNGHIVTNNHVVEGATEIIVKLSDGRELAAKLVGRDPKTDLALLKVEATGLPTIAMGDSSELKVGEPVMAIGNPFGLEQTVTTGIVSATGRVIGQGPYDDFVQTDASINPGNSGGPLINARGQAIGINAAIFSQSGGSVGIGFAIPSNQAKTVVMQLADSGRVSRSWLGVAIQPLTQELAKGFNLGDAKGALVSNVTDDSPADKAGIKAGDIITEYDGRKVARSEDLPRMWRRRRPGARCR